MSPLRVRQIIAARKAVQLLQQGDTFSGVAQELDETDGKVKAILAGIHTAEA